jgi:hypothetical protein
VPDLIRPIPQIRAKEFSRDSRADAARTHHDGMTNARRAPPCIFSNAHFRAEARNLS